MKYQMEYFDMRMHYNSEYSIYIVISCHPSEWNPGTHIFFVSSLHSPSLTHTCPQAACRGFTTSLMSNTKHQLGLHQPAEWFVDQHFIRYTSLLTIPENTCINIERMNNSHCTFSILCSGNLWAILTISELKVFRNSRSACSTQFEHHMFEDVPVMFPLQLESFKGWYLGGELKQLCLPMHQKIMPMFRNFWHVQVE